MLTMQIERLSTLTNEYQSQQRVRDFTRWLSALHESRGNTTYAAQRVFHRWERKALLPEFVTAVETLETKAAIAPGDTVDPSWAGALVTFKPFVDAFVGLSRSASLLGRIPGLRTVAFDTKVPTVTQAASYAWVGQGAPKPVSRLTLDSSIVLESTKCVGIVVTTDELARLAAPNSEAALRTELLGGLTEFTDRAFLDPASAAIAGIRPASITNGTTPTTPTGTGLADDVAKLLDEFFAANPGADDAVLVMTTGSKAKLSGAEGRQPFGLTTVTTGAAAGLVTVLDPAGVFVADDGAALDVSRYAAILMDDNPVPSASTVVRDLWGNNEAGFKVDRFVNWRAVTNAVKYVVTP